MRAGGAAVPGSDGHLRRLRRDPPQGSEGLGSSALRPLPPRLLHVDISHALFTHIDSDNTALDSDASGTDAQRRLLLSVLATAASVYSAKDDALTFPWVLSVVPRAPTACKKRGFSSAAHG